VLELRPLTFRRKTLDWSRTYVMGVVNVTPDSFSDGGRFIEAEAAVVHGRLHQAQGADLVDVGGESTRPGGAPVAAAVELERVLPVVRGLAGQVTVSIDTYKAEVAARAIEAGAEIVNDVSGGRLDPDLFHVCARADAALIVGHLRGTPETMAARATYQDVVREVIDELAEQVARARALGVTRILVDPGLGFAKRAEHNLALVRHLDALTALGCPIVVGASRKSFLGQLTGEEVLGRESATAAAHALAIARGANVVRVHDVAAQRAAAQVADAVLGRAA
jgi:dihydropteroate synthase